MLTGRIESQSEKFTGGLSAANVQLCDEAESVSLL